jgi:hypothetical protein
MIWIIPFASQNRKGVGDEAIGKKARRKNKIDTTAHYE